MIDTYGLTEFIRKLSVHSTKVLVIAMALFMLVYSVACIFLQLDSDMFGGDLIIVAFAITTVMSVLTIFTKKIDVFRLVGLFALMLAIQRFYVKFIGFSWDNNTYTVLFDLYFMGLAINLMVTGISFTFGKVIRRSSMMITSILMAIYEFIVLEFFSAPPTVGEAGFYYAYLICLIGMYLCIAGLMDVDLIRNSTRNARYSRSLEAFRNEYQYDRGSAVTHEVARALVDRSSPLWKPGTGEPVEAEMRFVIEGFSTVTYVIVQKWYGDDRLFFTVHDSPGSILFANRFAVDGIRLTDRKLTLVGKDGTNATIWVRD